MGRGAMLFAFLFTATGVWAQDVYVPEEAPAVKSELQVSWTVIPTPSPFDLPPRANRLTTRF